MKTTLSIVVGIIFISCSNPKNGIVKRQNELKKLVDLYEDSAKMVMNSSDERLDTTSLWRAKALMVKAVEYKQEFDSLDLELKKY